MPKQDHGAPVRPPWLPPEEDQRKGLFGRRRRSRAEDESKERSQPKVAKTEERAAGADEPAERARTYRVPPWTESGGDDAGAVVAAGSADADRSRDLPSRSLVKSDLSGTSGEQGSDEESDRDAVIEWGLDVGPDSSPDVERVNLEDTARPTPTGVTSAGEMPESPMIARGPGSSDESEGYGQLAEPVADEVFSPSDAIEPLVETSDQLAAWAPEAGRTTQSERDYQSPDPLSRFSVLEAKLRQAGLEADWMPKESESVDTATPPGGPSADTSVAESAPFNLEPSVDSGTPAPIESTREAPQPALEINAAIGESDSTPTGAHLDELGHSTRHDRHSSDLPDDVIHADPARDVDLLESDAAEDSGDSVLGFRASTGASLLDQDSMVVELGSVSTKLADYTESAGREVGVESVNAAGVVDRDVPVSSFVEPSEPDAESLVDGGADNGFVVQHQSQTPQPIDEPLTAESAKAEVDPIEARAAALLRSIDAKRAELNFDRTESPQEIGVPDWIDAEGIGAPKSNNVDAADGMGEEGDVHTADVLVGSAPTHESGADAVHVETEGVVAGGEPEAQGFAPPPGSESTSPTSIEFSAEAPGAVVDAVAGQPERDDESGLPPAPEADSALEPMLAPPVLVGEREPRFEEGVVVGGEPEAQGFAPPPGSESTSPTSIEFSAEAPGAVVDAVAGQPERDDRPSLLSAPELDSTLPGPMLAPPVLVGGPEPRLSEEMVQAEPLLEGSDTQSSEEAKPQRPPGRRLALPPWQVHSPTRPAPPLEQPLGPSYYVPPPVAQAPATTWAPGPQPPQHAQDPPPPHQPEHMQSPAPPGWVPGGLQESVYPPRQAGDGGQISQPMQDPAGQWHWGDVPPMGFHVQPPPPMPLGPPPPGWVPAPPEGYVPPPQYAAPPAAYQAPQAYRMPPSLDEARIVNRGLHAPRSGWRRAIHTASGGHVNPGDSRKDRDHEDLLARIRQPMLGDFRIAVLSIKGGVGKTTTTLGLGSAFAMVRSDRIIAVDANPDRGTLAERVRDQSTHSTVRDLLSDEHINSYADVRNHTRMATSRLEVLASEQDPAVSEAFGEIDYHHTIEILQRYYNIILTDCGTGIMHSAMAGVLDLAHSIVLVSSPAMDAARSASATLDWLMQHGHSGLVREAHVVLSASRPGSAGIKLDKVYEHFEARCKSIHMVPFDPHLAEGADVDFNVLRPDTNEAYLQLAGAIADNFSRLRAGGEWS